MKNIYSIDSSNIAIASVQQWSKERRNTDGNTSEVVNATGLLTNLLGRQDPVCKIANKKNKNYWRGSSLLYRWTGFFFLITFGKNTEKMLIFYIWSLSWDQVITKGGVEMSYWRFKRIGNTKLWLEYFSIFPYEYYLLLRSPVKE